jgi:hypothetical protein
MVETEVADAKSPLYGVLKAALKGGVQTVRIREGSVVIVSEAQWSRMTGAASLAGVPRLLEDILETERSPESELIHWRLGGP